MTPPRHRTPRPDRWDPTRPDRERCPSRWGRGTLHTRCTLIVGHPGTHLSLNPPEGTATAAWPERAAIPPSAHRPVRPHWICPACALPYPCGAARLGLLADFRGDRLSLALYLGILLREAIDDSYRDGRRPDGADLHTRFFGWLSRRSTAELEGGSAAGGVAST